MECGWDVSRVSHDPSLTGGAPESPFLVTRTW